MRRMDVKFFTQSINTRKKEMSKTAIKTNTAVDEIFDDLDRFRDFCRDFGYKFNESDLYNWKSYAYQQYSKFISGKRAKNMWEIDRNFRNRGPRHHRGRQQR